MPMNLVRLFQRQRVKVDFLLRHAGECAHRWKGTAVSSPCVNSPEILRSLRELLNVCTALSTQCTTQPSFTSSPNTQRSPGFNTAVFIRSHQKGFVKNKQRCQSNKIHTVLCCCRPKPLLSILCSELTLYFQMKVAHYVSVQNLQDNIILYYNFMHMQ